MIEMEKVVRCAVAEKSLKRQFCNKLKTAFLLFVALLTLGACNNRDKSEDELPTAAPTATLIAEVTAIPTFTPTAVPEFPSPTPTEDPTSVPTNTPVPNQAKTNIRANLRAGPGVAYGLVGVLDKGTEVFPVSRTVDRLWLKLEAGIWIFSVLVDDIPTNLPLETNIPAPPPPPATPTSPSPTEVPATATPTPTNTPLPVLGDWALPIHRSESFLMPDGLEITIREVIYGDDERMQSYIERRGGQSCTGCLAIELQIVNKDGNSKEYIVQEDFKLFNVSPDTEPFHQVRCEHAGSLRSMENQGGLRVLVKGLSDGSERFICFEGVDTLTLRTRLVYSPVFLYADPNTPTPTPEGSSVVYATEPVEKEQEFRTGWSVYFTLFGI